MKLSCRQNGLDLFVRKTLEAARERGSARVQLDPHGLIDARYLASRATRDGMRAHTLGEFVVILGVQKS